MAAPSRKETVRVLGYREFIKACRLMPREVQKELKEGFREAAEAVRAEGESLTAGRLRSPRSGSGYRIYVRERGVNVEQSLRKTTRQRPDWGRAQMRYSLIPALEDNSQLIIKKTEDALNQAQDFFERTARWQGEGLIGPLGS